MKDGGLARFVEMMRNAQAVAAEKAEERKRGDMRQYNRPKTYLKTSGRSKRRHAAQRREYAANGGQFISDFFAKSAPSVLAKNGESSDEESEIEDDDDDGHLPDEEMVTGKGNAGGGIRCEHARNADIVREFLTNHLPCNKALTDEYFRRLFPHRRLTDPISCQTCRPVMVGINPSP